jgi:hypothetical protein
MFAGRVGVMAEIAHDLDETLLMRGCFDFDAAAEETLAREFQNRIILRRLPREVTAFGFIAQRIVFARRGANPQPWQDNVDC